MVNALKNTLGNFHNLILDFGGSHGSTLSGTTGAYEATDTPILNLDQAWNT